MPSLRVKCFIKDFVKGFDLGKVFAVRSKRPTKDGWMQLSSITTHHEGNDSISADIPNDPRPTPPPHCYPSPAEPDFEAPTNGSSTRCTWGEPSSRKASDIAQTFLPLVQAVAGPIPLVGAPIKATIGGLLEFFKVMDRRGQNKVDLDSLASRLGRLQLDLCNAPRAQDHLERSRREVLISMLLETSATLTELRKRSLAYPSVTQDIAGCFTKIDRYMAEYLLSSQMQSRDDMCTVLANLERQQVCHERQQETLMEIKCQIIHLKSSMGPNVTLGFVKLIDATGRQHPIPMDVCDSFERFNKQLQLLLEHHSIEARIQRRYMEQGQYDLSIDDDKQVTRLTSHEWPRIEAGTKIVMSVVIEHQIPSEVHYKCPFCGDVNCLDVKPVIYSLAQQAVCSIVCRRCNQRFQISRKNSSARQDTLSANDASHPTIDAEMRLIRNLHVQQTSSSVKPYYDQPRTIFNNELQSIYGPTAADHVRWEVYSPCPPNTLVWHATVYIDDMNYGYGSSHTRGDAQDKTACMAYDHLRLNGPPDGAGAMALASSPAERWG